MLHTGILVIIQHMKQPHLLGVLFYSPRMFPRRLMHSIHLVQHGASVGRGRNAEKELARKIRIQLFLVIVRYPLYECL